MPKLFSLFHPVKSSKLVHCNYMGQAIHPDLASYYRARYYDPNVGRFLNEDPVRYLGGPNFYAYAQDNPINFADPRGLSPVCVWIGTSELTSWTTATREYTSPWNYAFATQDGGPDLESGVRLANLHCIWRRTYIRKVWETTLYLNTDLCIDHLACGANLVYLKFSVEKKTRYLGTEPGGTETTETRKPIPGWDSEFLDWFYCRGIPP